MHAHFFCSLVNAKTLDALLNNDQMQSANQTTRQPLPALPSDPRKRFASWTPKEQHVSNVKTEKILLMALITSVLFASALVGALIIAGSRLAGKPTDNATFAWITGLFVILPAFVGLVVNAVLAHKYAKVMHSNKK